MDFQLQGTFLATSAVLMCILVSGISAATESNLEVDSSVNGIIEIQAHIDGRDRLIMKGDTIQWHHFDFAAVGRHLGSNSPTIIGDAMGTILEWLPTWPSPPPDEIRFEAVSSVLQGIIPPIPSDGVTWQIEKVFGRGEVRIIEQPTSINDFALIVEFDDNAPLGSNFYVVILSKAPTDVEIDIKPWKETNKVYPRAGGDIWVAILSDTDVSSPFDPLSQVNISSVEFGPDGAEVKWYRSRDINRDGLSDLLLVFKMKETGILCGDNEATLTGETFDGQQFIGKDKIKTCGCAH
jgi:hypothetical protein